MRAIELKYLFINLVHHLVEKKITVTFLLCRSNYHSNTSLACICYMYVLLFCKPTTSKMYAQNISVYGEFELDIDFRNIDS